MGKRRSASVRPRGKRRMREKEVNLARAGGGFASVERNKPRHLIDFVGWRGRKRWWRGGSRQRGETWWMAWKKRPFGVTKGRMRLTTKQVKERDQTTALPAKRRVVVAGIASKELVSEVIKSYPKQRIFYLFIWDLSGSGDDVDGGDDNWGRFRWKDLATKYKAI